MSKEFSMEFEREHFKTQAQLDSALMEFLYALFNDLGYPEHETFCFQ